MMNYPTLDEAIRKRMAEIGMRSLNELAKKSGLSYPTVWFIVHGKTKNPSSSTLSRIAKALQITGFINTDNRDIVMAPFSFANELTVGFGEALHTKSGSEIEMISLFTELSEEAKKNVRELIQLLYKKEKEAKACKD